MSDNDDSLYLNRLNHINRINSQTIVMLYLKGISYTVCALPSESYQSLEKRRSWIERKIRDSGDYSIENISECIKISVFWYNYIHYRAKYNHLGEYQYQKWDKDLPEKIQVPEDIESIGFSNGCYQRHD